MVGSESKACTKCGINKPLVEFSIDNSNKTNGRCAACKDCQRQYRIKNNEEIIKRKKEYYEKNKTRINEHRHIFYKNNSKRINEKNREWIVSHPENRAKHSKTYYLKNRETILDYLHNFCKTPQGQLKISKANHVRRSREKKIPCTLTVKQWEKILVMQNSRCAICGKEFSKFLKPTRDHIIPLSKGGGLTFGNTQALCKSCNCSKNDKFDISKSLEQVFYDNIFYMKVGNSGYILCDFTSV